MYEELHFGWNPFVMNEETYEHSLRSFLANQSTGKATSVDIVHGYNETFKISIEYFYNLTTSLYVFSLPIPWRCCSVLHPYLR